MLRLITLELKKVRFEKNICISAGIILISMFFILAASNDSSLEAHTLEDAFRTIQMLMEIFFILFFSILNASLIISEYNNQTIWILFTYPVDRKKIILAKLLLITGFIAVSVLAGYGICCGFVIVLERCFDMFAGEFTVSMAYSWLATAVLTTIMFCALGLWTFVAGMWKKSVITTVVSSLVLIFLRQLVITSSEYYREDIWVFLAVLAATGVAVFLTVLKKLF